MIRESDKANGRYCERKMIRESRKAGCNVTKVPFGADFIESCPGEKSRVVEVKYGCGPISKTQRATKKVVEALGYEYDVRRCTCPTEFD